MAATLRTPGTSRRSGGVEGRAMSALPARVSTITYPESDGKPMGETDAHRREIAQLIEMLEQYYADQGDVYVSGNLMFYYEEGEPASVVSPDVFVVRGVPKGLRRVYKLWEERHAPAVVIEITSRSTRLEDKGTKRALYAMLGVREYFLFDPLAEYLRPPLQGFTLAGDEYAAIAPEPGGALVSRELGMRLARVDNQLQLTELASGRRLLRPAELDVARRQAEQQTQVEADARRRAEQQTRAETEARRQAEAEIERLRAEIERLKQQ
jgi:Uma2 family endonuclease